MQWLKSYFDSHCNGQNLSYDAAARRAASKTGGVKGVSGKPRMPLASAATTANINGAAAPVRQASINKKAPGTRQFGQAVQQPAAVSTSVAQDAGIAAQVQEAAEQVPLLPLRSFISRTMVCSLACHLVLALGEGNQQHFAVQLQTLAMQTSTASDKT